MNDSLKTIHPDELKELRTRLLHNLQRLEQESFAKSIDLPKENAHIDSMRHQLDATANLLDSLGKHG